MSADELRSHITAVPFRPFLLHAADGRRIPVIGRDFILITPTGRSAYVFQPDDRWDVVDLLLAGGVSYPAPGQPLPQSAPQQATP